MVEYHVCSDKDGYGIEAFENGKSANRVDGLFDSESDACKFAKLCTELELSPIHLMDVSDDILFLKKCSKFQH